ncbi:hypothetical protein HELRODRAFT_178677 [Helobdella robusta]|uniref:Uncharacterized protein n=1 Tax=Helobdella robusta TaxID=6412 RepID=T1FDK0_HELRO|nr:hypothetical protein HELRODRAFT_178677 [Helobdella robusta]ESN96877.1 hypothetical protein HELRODRAFT_178677 [Helobdella robusta]
MGLMGCIALVSYVAISPWKCPPDTGSASKVQLLASSSLPMSNANSRRGESEFLAPKSDDPGGIHDIKLTAGRCSFLVVLETVHATEFRRLQQSLVDRGHMNSLIKTYLKLTLLTSRKEGLKKFGLKIQSKTKIDLWTYSICDLERPNALIALVLERYQIDIAALSEIFLPDERSLAKITLYKTVCISALRYGYPYRRHIKALKTFLFCSVRSIFGINWRHQITLTNMFKDCMYCTGRISIVTTSALDR